MEIEIRGAGLLRISHNSLRILVGTILMLSPGCGSDGNGVEPPKDPPVVQLLLNTSIEEGSGSPDYWNSGEEGPQPGNDYAFEWSASESNSGSRSLMISLDTSVDASAFAHWSQSIDSDIPHGEELTLKASVKTNLTGQGAGFMVRVDDSSGPVAWATTQGQVSISGVRDWHVEGTTLNTVPEGATDIWVFLMIFPNTTGSIYFDDVKLTYN